MSLKVDPFKIYTNIFISLSLCFAFLQFLSTELCLPHVVSPFLTLPFSLQVTISFSPSLINHLACFHLFFFLSFRIMMLHSLSLHLSHSLALSFSCFLFLILTGIGAFLFLTLSFIVIPLPASQCELVCSFRCFNSLFFFLLSFQFLSLSETKEKLIPHFPSSILNIECINVCMHSFERT